MKDFAVWGCGIWPERAQVLPVDEPPDVIHENHPAFDLLPPEFVADWANCFSGDHWAVVVTCEEADLDAATRFSPNVYGWKETAPPGEER